MHADFGNDSVARMTEIIKDPNTCQQDLVDYYVLADAKAFGNRSFTATVPEVCVVCVLCS